MIVLLELLTALLEYIDLILQLSFSQQEFTLSYKYLTYYAGIMLNAFRYYYAQNYASIIGGSLYIGRRSYQACCNCNGN